MIPATRLGVLGVLGILVAASMACSSGGGETTTPDVLGTTASAAAVTSVADAPAGATSPSTSPLPVTTATESGVPGLDSDDDFCRGWSRFAASFQALALASVSSTDPVDAIRLEVIAAGALLAAVASLDSAYPDALIAERSEFVDGLLGPLTRRAERARDELLAAGLSEADVDDLGTEWLDALAAAGTDDPDLTVAVRDDLRPAVEAATAELAADVPLIVDDPSLVTDAAAEDTLAYISANCPDQGTLGGNDVID